MKKNNENLSQRKNFSSYESIGLEIFLLVIEINKLEKDLTSFNKQILFKNLDILANKLLGYLQNEELSNSDKEKVKFLLNTLQKSFIIPLEKELSNVSSVKKYIDIITNSIVELRKQIKL